jgi:hypothetical protein
MALFREFDFFVLISGDADHEMLARNTKLRYFIRYNYKAISFNTS